MANLSRKLIDADEIADGRSGTNIAAQFTNQFTVVRPSVQRVNVDFAAAMLKELDHEAETLNLSRQAVIKTMLREALDRRCLAQQARQTH